MLKHIVMDLNGNVVSVDDLPTDVDPAEALRRAVHDCPDCQAAIARGEQPRIVNGPGLEALRPEVHRLFERRPRWRKLKRGR